MTDPNGTEMYRWITDLFPICRSITGDGTLESLRYFAEILPEMKIQSVRSGTQVFDWTVPNEWNISDAYIKDANGNKIYGTINYTLYSSLLEYMFRRTSDEEGVADIHEFSNIGDI